MSRWDTRSSSGLGLYVLFVLIVVRLVSFPAPARARVPVSPPDLVLELLRLDGWDLDLTTRSISPFDAQMTVMRLSPANYFAERFPITAPALRQENLSRAGAALNVNDVDLHRYAVTMPLLPPDTPGLRTASLPLHDYSLSLSRLAPRDSDLDLRTAPRTRSHLSIPLLPPSPPQLVAPLLQATPADLKL